MSVKTKRWCDPIEHDDGWRILVCRYRPRGLPKKQETWDIWLNQLGPSPLLHAKARGRNGLTPLSWPAYKKRYLHEIQKKEPQQLLACLTKIVESDNNITLLCSKSCLDENYCHRTLLKQLIISRLSTEK